MDEAPFLQLIEGLRQHGRLADAEALESLKVVGWTSASEMIGEMGHAILDLQRDLPDELRPIAARCIDEVRKVWPRIGRRKPR